MDAAGALFAAAGGGVLVYPRPGEGGGGAQPLPAFTIDGFGEVGGLAVPAAARVPDGLVYVSSPGESRVTLIARNGTTLVGVVHKVGTPRC